MIGTLNYVYAKLEGVRIWGLPVVQDVVWQNIKIFPEIVKGSVDNGCKITAERIMLIRSTTSRWYDYVTFGFLTCSVIAGTISMLILGDQSSFNNIQQRLPNALIIFTFIPIDLAAVGLYFTMLIVITSVSH
jgi:hypothetical protein